MTYFDASFASVYHDEECDAVVGKQTEFADGEDFREYMNELITAVEDTGCDTMIADTSEFQSALTEDDQAWSVTEWSPRAEGAGLENLAMVMPEAVVAEMSVDAVVEMSEDTLNRELFDDFQDAQEWASQQ
jgi:hypothetical protein